MIPDAKPFAGRTLGTLRAPALGLLLATALALPGCVSLQLFGGLPEPLVETHVQGAHAGGKILLLEIDGVLSFESEQGDLLSPELDNPVSRVREELDAARNDELVRALLVRIDSPGGTATASDVIYGELQRFKEERKIPVVAYLMGTAASGGYYVAMAADTVIAHPTTVTGSIGVLFTGVSLEGLMEKLGIENQTLTAGAHKDAGSPLRSMTGDERSHIQSVLDDLHERFKSVVARGRPKLAPAALDALADGRIFSASQARENGLVDELGDFQTAVELARGRAALGQARVVTYHRPDEYANNLYTRAPLPRSLRIELPQPLRTLTQPGFYYLWAPALQ